MTGEDVERLLAAIEAWASERSDVLSLAVIGSWARGGARADSDLDLMLLVDAPEAYRGDASWLSAIDWKRAGFEAAGFEDADYGKAWSRHLRLDPLAEVEFTFGDPAWASTDPPDPGSIQVVAKGCRILLDRTGLLRRFVDSIGRED